MMQQRLKKIFLSLAVLLGFTGYAARFHHEENEGGIVTPPITNSSETTGQTPSVQSSDDEESSVQPVNTAPTPSITAPTTNSSSPTPTSTTQPSTVSKGKYRNGAYTGPVTDAFYGNVQVRVTISGGALTDVKFLQYPNDRSTSVSINQQAMPYLRQEAIQAQSANVDGVSGATATSGAFRESLGVALQQAS